MPQCQSQSQANDETCHYFLDDVALLACCRREAFRASGPGGQHVQKNACGVRLHIRLSSTEISAQCQDFRSAEANTKRALRELRIRLALNERNCGCASSLQKFTYAHSLKINVDNSDYCLVVAYLIDVLEQNDYVLAAAATVTGVSASQIIKCLKLHKMVWQHLQAARAQRGLAVLK